VARRTPQALVRHLVAAIGFASALWLWARA
jgi:hypothetical protein